MTDDSLHIDKAKGLPRRKCEGCGVTLHKSLREFCSRDCKWLHCLEISAQRGITSRYDK